MSYPEAKYTASFLTTLLVSLIYANRVSALYAAGYFVGADGMALTGKAILIFIGAVVVAGIIGQIIVAVIMAAAGFAREMIEDEREKLIELKAIHIAFSIFGAGFLASSVALAWGRPAFEVFHYIILSMVFCGLAADAIRIWLLRRGF